MKSLMLFTCADVVAVEHTRYFSVPIMRRPAEECRIAREVHLKLIEIPIARLAFSASLSGIYACCVVYSVCSWQILMAERLLKAVDFPRRAPPDSIIYPQAPEKQQTASRSAKKRAQRSS
jgi:hypothetical protein